MFEKITLNLFSFFFSIYSIYQIVLFVKYVIYQRILVRFFKKPVNLKESGQWAVVTGCTDGIGRAFAYKLAENGMDVVLISRTKTKLDSLANDLSEKYDVKTKIIVADFTDTDKVVPLIQKEIDDLDIGVLVNNVGVSTGVALFLECNRNEIMDMIEINIKATVRMCSVVLPYMVKKRGGVIINISSLSAVLPSPLISCYGATKAFIMKFSTDLNKEYNKSGITIHCLTSGFVGTKMTNLTVTPYVIPSAETYVESALKTIGLADVTTGYSYHDIFECLLKFVIQISKSLHDFLTGVVLRFITKFIDVPSTAARSNNIK